MRIIVQKYGWSFWMLFLLVTNPFTSIAQAKKMQASQVVSRLESITRLWLADTIFLQASIVLTSGFSGAAAFDSVTVPVAYWKTRDEVYGKFGDQEWIENDSMLLLVDLEQKIMKLEMKTSGNAAGRNGLGMFPGMDSLAQDLEKGNWEADLSMENGYETLKLSTKDYLAEKQWPAGESSIKFQLSTGLPQSMKSIERKMQLVDSAWEEAWAGQQKPVVVKAVVDKKNKEEATIAISEKSVQYHFSEIKLGGNLTVPAKPFDRIGKDADGIWKPIGDYQLYELMFED